MDLAALAAALEASHLGVAMRGARGLYPAANVAHLAGLLLLVGPIGMLDLRVLGFGRAIPIAPLSRMATPLAAAGLVVLAVSGFLLYAPDAGPLFRSGMFRWKLALAAIALLNAMAFRCLFPGVERGEEPPPLARLMSGASIGLWLVVACLGRLIAYS